MKGLLAAVLMMIGMVGQAWDGNDYTMYWMVTESATVDGGNIQSFLDNYPEDYDNWNAARVKVFNSNESKLVDILMPTETGWELINGYEGMPFGDSGSGFWGCGVPTGNQSPLNDIDVLIAEEYLIQAEIGRLTWNYDTDAPDWTTLAYSEYERLTSDFKYDHMYDPGDTGKPDAIPWVPMKFYTIGGYGESYTLSSFARGILWRKLSEAKELTYYLLDGKTVDPEPHSGTLTKVSSDRKFGLLVTEDTLQPLQNLLLKIDDIEVYAKVKDRGNRGCRIGFTTSPEGFPELIS